MDTLQNLRWNKKVTENEEEWLKGWIVIIRRFKEEEKEV